MTSSAPGSAQRERGQSGREHFNKPNVTVLMLRTPGRTGGSDRFPVPERLEKVTRGCRQRSGISD